MHSITLSLEILLWNGRDSQNVVLHNVPGRAVGKHSDRKTQPSEKAGLFKEVAFKQRQAFRMNQPGRLREESSRWGENTAGAWLREAVGIVRELQSGQYDWDSEH